MANGDDWLTVQQAAKLTGYHPDHLRVLIRDGRIEARKFGPVWAINRQSLNAYIQKMRERGEKRGPKG